MASNLCSALFLGQLQQHIYLQLLFAAIIRIFNYQERLTVYLAFSNKPRNLLIATGRPSQCIHAYFYTQPNICTFLVRATRLWQIAVRCPTQMCTHTRPLQAYNMWLTCAM